MRKGNANGFTLIEMIIVVAIMAILAVIAYPSYTKYVYRARRTEGQNFLIQIAAAEERYYTNFNSYTSNIVSAGTPPMGLGFSSTASVPGGYYTISGGAVTLTNAGQGFTVAAVPQGVQAGDGACASLIIDNTGSKTWTTTSGALSNGSCW